MPPRPGERNRADHARPAYFGNSNGHPQTAARTLRWGLAATPIAARPPAHLPRPPRPPCPLTHAQVVQKIAERKANGDEEVQDELLKTHSTKPLDSALQRHFRHNHAENSIVGANLIRWCAAGRWGGGGAERPGAGPAAVALLLPIRNRPQAWGPWPALAAPTLACPAPPTAPRAPPTAQTPP